MLFGRPDIFGHRDSARIYLDEGHLAKMGEHRPDVAIHVIHDRFSLSRVPIVYYNAKFGVPPIPSNPGVLAGWRTKDFQAVTEFQLRTRGVKLDKTQREGFEQGDWIAIVPAHRIRGRAGQPGRGTIGAVLTEALYAHCVRASRVLQMAQFRSERDKNPYTRFGARYRDKLENLQLAEVKRIFNEASGDFRDPELPARERNVTTANIRMAGRSAVKKWFNAIPTGIRAQAYVEILCYEQIYGPFSYQEVADRELPIISVLRRAQLRAISVHRIKRETARHQVAKGAPVSRGTKARLDYGKEFDLNLWGGFIVALYGGINPATLYGEFESLTDLFDLAAWLGYYARGQLDELPPEIAATLINCLSTKPRFAVIEDDIKHLEKIYTEIRYLADLLVGEERLREAAQQAMRTKAPVEVAPLYYNIIITPNTAEPDDPDARIDPRFMVGKGHEGINLSVDYENFPQMTKDEKLHVRRFRPLLW